MAKSLAEAARDAIKEVERVKENLTLSFQSTLVDVGESLVYYTPLKTGLASSNWNVTDSGQISVEREPQEGVKGEASLKAIKSQVKSIHLGEIVTFYNPVDYIVDLENGTSRQAPSGMVTPTKPRVTDMWLSNLRKYELI